MKRKMEDHSEGDFRSKLKLIRNSHSPPLSPLIYFQRCYGYTAGQLQSETPAELGLCGWVSAPRVCSARWAGLVGGAHFMPCWKTELRRVLQMMRSAHCTTTMLAKKAVWHVNSTTFRCS